MERSKSDEFANALTHGVGTILSAVAAVVLIWRSETAVFNIWLGSLVYSFSLVGVYATSTLSHIFTEGERQQFFRRLDQAFIYLLIVGSYTPFSVAYLSGTWWWMLLGLMWGLAIAGFISKLFFAHRVQTVSVVLYLLLGWIPAFGGMPWSDQLPLECRLWIIYGGIAYSLGTVFLFNDKRFPYFHAVWHLFVMLGSTIHYWAILTFVVQS